MNPPASDHRYFAAPLLFFCLFVALQIGTGATLYFVHIGMDPTAVFEYYRGSEAMLAVFPDATDHFREPRTAAGLVKIAIGHLVAYGSVVFLLAHWLRSLGRDRPGGATRDRLILFMFLCALADILIGFAATFGPAVFIYLRPFVFLCFEGSLAIGVGMLLRLYFLLSRKYENKTSGAGA